MKVLDIISWNIYTLIHNFFSSTLLTASIGSSSENSVLRNRTTSEDFSIKWDMWNLFFVSFKFIVFMNFFLLILFFTSSVMIYYFFSDIHFNFVSTVWYKILYLKIHFNSFCFYSYSYFLILFNELVVFQSFMIMFLLMIPNLNNLNDFFW